MQWINEGSTADIYRKGNIICKQFFSESYYYRDFLNEARIIEHIKTSRLDFFPEYYHTNYDKGCIYMSYVDGKEINEDDLRKKYSYECIISIINKFTICMTKIINSGILPRDLHFGNVLYNERTGKLTFIDLGYYIKISDSTEYQEPIFLTDLRNCVSGDFRLLIEKSLEKIKNVYYMEKKKEEKRNWKSAI